MLLQVANWEAKTKAAADAHAKFELDCAGQRCSALLGQFLHYSFSL